jgi:hypothetical protein
MPYLQVITRFLMLTCVLLITHNSLLITAAAQSATATLSGEVVDQNGAVVPGANVTVTNNGTGQSRHATTNDSGNFTVPLLPPGTYSIGAQREGFAPVRVPDLILNVGDQKALQIQLKAGDVNATVTVDSNVETVRTDGSVGTVVDQQFVANIPLNGRSFQSLITLTPGVVVVPAGIANTAGQFSVNGQRASANGFTVDGVSANVGAVSGNFGGAYTSGNLPGLTTFGTTQSLVSVDALQEFKIQTSSYAAEYGRQPGGQISIVTRSGTNQFHGSLFDYLRNDVFDANDWFANANQQAKAAERQNDFGGTLSGPLLLPRFGEGGQQPRYNGRNRTFFFFSYEGLRLRLPQFNLTNVPTLALRQQAPTVIQPLLNGFPLPNGKDLGNGLAEFTSGYSDPSSLDATSIRVDHAFNGKLTLFARYNQAPSQSIFRRADVSLSQLQSNQLSAQTITLGATASLTRRISNDLRVNYSSNGAYFARVLDDFGGAVPPPRSLLIPSQYDSGAPQGTVQLNFSGRTSTSVPSLSILGNFVSSQHQFNVVDNFSYAVGSHQLKFGLDFRRLSPILGFNSYLLQTTFASRQQVLAASAGDAVVAGQIRMFPVFLNFSAYAEDTWRISRRVTLDFGLRWEVNPAPSEQNGNIPTVVTQIDNLATMQLAPLGTKLWNTTYNNFAPRLGFAWQVSQAPGREVVVRGGFGVFYDTGNDLAAQNFNGARYPYGFSRTISNVGYPLSPTQVAPAPLPIQTGLPLPYPAFFVFDPALRLPYTLQWNFAVEQSLGKSQTFTVSYVGAAGRRLLQETQLSLARINPSFTSIFLTRNSASSDYDALQAQFQRRLSRGLQALVSYTWSHALDDDSASTRPGRVAQRGNASFDVRQVFAAAATYDITSPTTSPLARAILGHWSIDTTVHAQSALPVDLIAATLTNPADGSIINVRPNVQAGTPWYIDDPTVPGARRINRAAFSTPAAGQSGTLGRNQVRGLGAWQVDSALRRQFKLTEKVNLQFRAEAFNLFNHPNFGTVQTSLTAQNFGQATGMLNRQLGGISQLYQIGGPRSFQFALKLLF